MAVPAKYRAIGDFHEYYSGARKAPYLTIFVGGNHEASNHLFELFHGGWVAPNIYYMGAANVIQVGGLRIAGLSGIWYGSDYRKPHYERLPYNQSDVRSIYHVREIDVRRLLRIQKQVDVVVSHDWPRKIEWDGDHKWLFRKKDQFEGDSRTGKLGSQAARYLLDYLRPARWFAAHLHIRFAATAKFAQSEVSGAQVSESRQQQDTSLSQSDGDGQPPKKQMKLDLPEAEEVNAGAVGEDDEEEDAETLALRAMLPAGFSKPSKPHSKDPTANGVIAGKAAEDDMAHLRNLLPASFAKPNHSSGQDSHTFHNAIPPVPSSIFNKQTEFLALDKCLPGRRFLEMVEVSPISASGEPATAAFSDSGEALLTYDPEWLAITRMMSSELSFDPDSNRAVPVARSNEAYLAALGEHQEWIKLNVVDQKELEIPQNFVVTAPVYDGNMKNATLPEEYDNPQTQAFCGLIGIENKLKSSPEEKAERMAKGPRAEDEGYRGGGSRGGRGGGRGGGGRGQGGGGGRGRGRGRGRGYGSANHTPIGER